MRQTSSFGLLIGLLTVGVAGCAAAIEPAGPADPPATPGPEVQAMQTLESITAAVLKDAARRTGLDATGLKVESAETVTWADGSLGCPQPGMSYTMALVPGYRIKVSARGQLLDYHASRRGFFFICPAGVAQDPAGEERM